MVYIEKTKSTTNWSTNHLDFSKSTCNSEGSYFVQVICNALWYTTNHQSTINDAAIHKAEVKPFPQAFEGYNDVKRKKLKTMPTKASELDSHSEALYSLLLKPILNSSVPWKRASDEIKDLADCLAAYSSYLKKKNREMTSYHESEYPARPIANDATVEHRHRSAFGVKQIYTILDDAVRSADENKPVIFDEFKHVETPFSRNQDRAKFFENIQLSVLIDAIRFSPGGSSISVVCIFHVKESWSLPEMLTDGARFLQTARPHLKEFHTRAQRRHFKEKLKNVASVQPAVSDMIYKELTMDSTALDHPITQEILRLIFLGNTGLIPDLRTLNPGRPSGQFDTFFNVLSVLVENITAADDRRHGATHLSEELISLDEMISKAKSECPKDCSVPSKSLVRLQFAPRNPYAKAAQNFKSRLNVQYKIQRRQLRVSHPDEHFCNAQLKYLKEMAIEQRSNSLLYFCDDKAKVPFGDPDHFVSTGVRGRMSIVPTSSTLSALDHDMTRASVTPSVLLQCEIPNDIKTSFVRGKVTTIINDSAFQMASPFRHNAVLAKLISNTQEAVPPILIKFTDGGTDQRNTLESVRCATICLFKEMNFDMVILGRCAPGHSYINPAERIMSILNIGLQNVALSRKASTDENEAQFRKCNSMNELRERAKRFPELKQAWQESVEPVQSLIRNRFLRLSLKDESFGAMDPVNEKDIDIFKRHLRELFPDLNLQKLVKAETRKSPSCTAWIEKHCRMRHYTFQIRKCQDLTCCSAPSLPYQDLKWLPDPILDSDGEHFLPYTEVKLLPDTDETGRPTLRQSKVQKPKQKEVKADLPQGPEVDPDAGVVDPNVRDVDQDVRLEDPEAQVEVTEEHMIDMPVPDPHLCTTQNVRAVVTCIECCKPRTIYSRHKLTDRQLMSVILATSEYEYSRGSPLLPPKNNLYKTVICTAYITCSFPVEIQCSSGLGRNNICCLCASDNAEVDTELKKRYKTGLPVNIRAKSL